MTVKRSSWEAQDTKIGMRVAELEAFLADARQSGATGQKVIQVTTVGFLHPRIKTAAVSTKTATAGTD